MAKFSRNMIRLEDACERYLQRAANEGKAAQTLTSTRYVLECLCDGIGNPWMHLITDEQMDRYCYGPKGLWMGKRGKPVKALSFNRYIGVLKQFFEYAQLMHWTDVNPTRAIKNARRDPPKRMLLLSASELVALLEACQNPVERIACALGMNLGLRANDIRHLTVGDVSLASGVIQTEIRKTKKIDDKEITADLHTELIRWLDAYAELTGLVSRQELPNHWYLMPTYKSVNALGGRERQLMLYPERIYSVPWNLIKRPLSRIGHETTGEGFHTLRRSSARLFFERLRAQGEGRDHALMIVKDYLGHANTAMTEHYLGLSVERTLRTKELKGQAFISAMAQEEQQRLATDETIRAIGE